MTVSLNGTFSAGKATTAQEMVTQPPDARISGAGP